MKLPEPIAWCNRETGMITRAAAVKKALALAKWEGVFTEAQFREALAQQEAVMRQALRDSGLMDYEIRGAIEKLEEALK